MQKTEDRTVAGLLILERNDGYQDELGEWLIEARKLLDHVYSILSFGSGFYFQVPLIEYHDANQFELEVTSAYPNASSASLPVCSHINLQPLFDAAIKSHCHPQIEIKNLDLVIAWFVTNSTNLEVRLVNYITAIECIINSNLAETDIGILPEKEFSKNRKELRRKLKECLQNWDCDDEKKDEVIKEINERLADLNRRSFFKKLYALAKNWSIPINDLSEQEIKAAIRARNEIIHQGKSGKNIPDLWGHTMLLREVSTRFILTAISYQGVYISQHPKFEKIIFSQNVH